MANIMRNWRGALVLVLLHAVAACGGGGDDAMPDAGDPGPGPGPGSGSGGSDDQTYVVGGTVTGLSGSGLTISNNSSDELELDAAGGFAFAGELGDGASYDVEVVAQPVNPDNVCTIENGSGTVDGADVGDIEILCTGPLALAGSAPAEGDQAVSRAIQPILTFTAGIDASTVIADSVLLASAAGGVDLAFDVAGSDVTLSPASILLPLTDYTLTVTTDVTGSGGERMLEAATVSFRTRDAAWLEDREIGTNSADVAEAEIAFDADGNALAVWSQATLDSSDLWWNYYAAGVGWGTPEPLEQYDDDQYAGSVQLAFDTAGNALAVWILNDSVANATSVRGSRFAVATGWETPDFIETEAGTVVGTADMVVNSSGDAVAVWAQFDGSFQNLWWNRYTAGIGWGVAEVIDESDDVVENPRAAMNDDGDILVVWPMRDIGNFAWDVWGRRFTAAGGWEDSTLLSTDNDFEAVTPRPVMDRDGNALVIWVQGLGLEAGLYASRYPAGSAPGEPGQLSVSEELEGPQLAIDPEGNAMALWQQGENVNGTYEMLAYASRYSVDAGGEWDTPQPISNLHAFYPKVAVDASGHALAAWFELDITAPLADAWSVWANRYTNGGGWTAAERIGSMGGLIGTGMPNLAIDPNGDAFAIWTRGTEVRVNRFE